jgi:RNA polymerase sigma-70 factor (ECF subfamily)
MTIVEFQYELISLQSKLMLFAYRLTLDKENARDLVQETNLRALNFRDKFASKTNLYAWTYTIMKNTFINGYRYNLNHINISKSINGTGCVLQSNFDNANNPDAIYMKKELESVINSLEYNLKITFNMFLEGYKYSEIAENLGVNMGTVRSRIFLARKKLMARLNGDFYLTSKKPCNWEIL